MTAIAQKLSEVVGIAFETINLPIELGAVRTSDRPDLAQFQCNGAMIAAKQARKRPYEVAQLIVNDLSQKDIFSSVDVSGLGFINLSVTDKFLKDFLISSKYIFEECEMVNCLKDKPFKTFDGDVICHDDSISMAKEKTDKLLSEIKLSEDIDCDEYNDIAIKLSIAAIKFADIQNQRQSNYIFDLDKVISFEEKTGSYLLYQTVGLKSLLRKAREREISYANSELVIQSADRDLALVLCRFADAVNLSNQRDTAHYLWEHLFKLAAVFSSFYGNCDILSEKDEMLRGSRLILCEKTAEQLEQGLNMLGVLVPARM